MGPDDVLHIKVEGGGAAIHVKLAFEDPFMFGMILVDAARTIANSYASAEEATDAEQYLMRLKQGFDAEWDKATTEIRMSKQGEDG